MFILNRKTIIMFLLALAVFIQSCISATASDYEFYFFGVNSKTFKNSNLMMITAGAITSIITHELGHMIYFESQGKDWALSQSPAGFAVHTDNYLTDSQYRNLGWSGFVFQTGVGTLLRSFKRTRHSDFTKGFICMNVAELWTYELRPHNKGDDFASIERGGGNKDTNLGILALVNYNNIAALSNQNPMPSSIYDYTDKTGTSWLHHFDDTVGQYREPTNLF
jgi:hypothetical protein